MINRSRLGVLLALAAFLVSISAPGPARADLVGPPTLQGELLATTGELFDRGASCNPNGTTTQAFHWTGVASGPFPGTFVEDGTLTIGPQTGIGAGRFGFQLGPVLSFDATFTIDSVAGTATGTKHLITPVASSPFPLVQDARYADSSGMCTTFSGLSVLGLDNASGFAIDVRATLHYEATITTPAGTTQDRGLSFVEAVEATAAAGISSAGTGGAKEIFPLSELTPAPPVVTVSPPAATNPVGTSHTVTATVLTAALVPLQGVTVRFTVAGSTSAAGSCTTGAAGQCSFTYAGPLLPGADTILAYPDLNGNGVEDPGETEASAVKAWVLPASTRGQVTGGGQIVPAAGTEEVSFGLEARSGAKLLATCSVVDRAAGVHVKCVDATALVQSPTHATFFGSGTVDGVPTSYRIDVDDLGNPGAGRDTFKLQTGTGYAVAGVLARGDVQIHG
jgi:hypothetical protein